jgi:tRNA(fMet)-specific endonuclease VapC
MDTTAVLIDTNLFIEHIRAKDKASTALALLHSRRNTLLTSSIVAAELCYGARTPAMRGAVTTLLSITRIIAFTPAMALRMSSEVQRLKEKNAIIGFRDLAVACVALEEKLPVATHNRREFERVEGLILFNLGSVDQEAR